MTTKAKATKATITVYDVFNDYVYEERAVDLAVLGELGWAVRGMVRKRQVLAALNGGNAIELKIVPHERDG